MTRRVSSKSFVALLEDLTEQGIRPDRQEMPSQELYGRIQKHLEEQGIITDGVTVGTEELFNFCPYWIVVITVCNSKQLFDDHRVFLVIGADFYEIDEMSCASREIAEVIQQHK